SLGQRRVPPRFFAQPAKLSRAHLPVVAAVPAALLLVLPARRRPLQENSSCRSLLQAARFLFPAFSPARAFPFPLSPSFPSSALLFSFLLSAPLRLPRRLTPSCRPRSPCRLPE